ncbi:hypothetical protein DL98DRAFT_596609 [Cadophora sp. DSE1049]|nr:hypothetical protein DL98DRAFT_596609 [Cadophora sp. DSE1049]
MAPNPSISMNFLIQILFTIWALYIRAWAWLRDLIIFKMGNNPCPWEPLPHEPSLYDSPFIMSVLLTWLFLGPLVCFIIAFAICHVKASLYWEFRIRKREFMNVFNMNPEAQLRAAQILCPDVEWRVRRKRTEILTRRDIDIKYERLGA